jgi:hypothetical protein
MDFQSFAAKRTEELKSLVREALDRNREQVEAEISRLAESFFANMEDAYKASTEESWFDRVAKEAEQGDPLNKAAAILRNDLREESIRFHTKHNPYPFTPWPGTVIADCKESKKSKLSELEDQIEADIQAKKEQGTPFDEPLNPSMQYEIFKSFYDCLDEHLTHGRISYAQYLMYRQQVIRTSDAEGILKEIENANKPRFTPKRADIYWAIDLSHGPQEKWWAGAEDDIYAHAIGNCFKTKQEAEEGLERIKELLLR